MSGLAGLGDLVLTCTGDLSRNRQVGLKLAAGLELGRILDSTPMVAEGVTTTSVALKLAARHGVDLPIAAEMHAVLNHGPIAGGGDQAADEPGFAERSGTIMDRVRARELPGETIHGSRG